MKIFTFWRVYFLFWGTLAALVLMNPGLIWLGHWIFYSFQDWDMSCP